MWIRQPTDPKLKDKIYHYVWKRGARGVMQHRIYNVFDYDWDSISDALAELRDEMTLACTNKIWYVLNEKKRLDNVSQV